MPNRRIYESGRQSKNLRYAIKRAYIHRFAYYPYNRTYHSTNKRLRYQG